MLSVLLGPDQRDEWDAFIAGSDTFSMMQSWAWGDVKETLGWEADRVAVKDGERIVAAAQVLTKRFPLGLGSLAYIPRGPIGDWQPEEVAGPLFDAVHEAVRERGAVFLKLEPPVAASPELAALLGNLGFAPSDSSNQPAATVIVDIAPDDETILRNMRNSTRRKIQAAERKGVEVRRGTPDDIELFYDLMETTSKRTGATLRSREYYETEFGTFYEKGRALMLLGEYEGQTLAAHVAYSYGEHAAFFHQASSDSRSNLNPNCLLVWEQIKWAKAMGCRTLDLWGIPDEIGTLLAEGQEIPSDRTDGLWGVFRFKHGFSKDIVVYAGSFDHVYAAKRYAVISRQMADGSASERISAWMDTHLRR
jgi:lipid II:glycine glycyltransferase (peptidoglycan interpeptide bridge formation enzyme)